MTKKSILYLAAIIIVSIIAVVLISITEGGAVPPPEPVVPEPPQPEPPQPEPAVEITSETISSELLDIGEFCTAERSFTHTERNAEKAHVPMFKNRKSDPGTPLIDFAVPGTKHSYEYVFNGYIRAGIKDFSKAEVQIVKPSKSARGTIRVVLPNVEILARSLDTKNYEIVEEHNNFLNPIKPDEIIGSLDNVLNDEEEKAITQGILVEARENAETRITDFIKEILPQSAKSQYEIQVTCKG